MYCIASIERRTGSRDVTSVRHLKRGRVAPQRCAVDLRLHKALSIPDLRSNCQNPDLRPGQVPHFCAIAPDVKAIRRLEDAVAARSTPAGADRFPDFHG